MFSSIYVRGSLQYLDLDQMLWVLSSVVGEKVAGHCTEVMAMSKMALVVSPASAHSLDLVVSSRCSPHIVSIPALLPAG